MPSKQEIKRWFASQKNGLGTLGNERVRWLDLDVKQFENQFECDRAMKKILARQPSLKETLLEKTHSGGYRIGVKVKKPVEFTNFCLEPGGNHVGECLGAGRFTVLAPTVGLSGKAYESINCPEQLVEIETIDFIYPTKKKTANANRSSISTHPRLDTTCLPGALELEQLGHSDSRRVLEGENIKSDRSDSLTTAIREWAGWHNWCHDKGITITGSVEELAHCAGERLGIERELSDAEGGGLLLQVKRSLDNRQRRVLIRSIESLTVKDFALALTRTYGKGIVCNLKNEQLGALLHTKLIS